jgi:DNA-binding MarR family transcriptional regulator
MAEIPDAYATDVAAAVRASVGLLLRRMRQVPVDGELTLPESSAVTRLDRGGPATSSALARLEQISPQSMGATLAGLEARGLITRRPDPDDGRRSLLSVSEAGRQVLRNKRNARTEQLARALSASFTTEELGLLKAAAPLLERLAQSI